MGKVRLPENNVYKIKPQLFIKLGFKYQKQNIIAVLKTCLQLICEL